MAVKTPPNADPVPAAQELHRSKKNKRRRPAWLLRMAAESVLIIVSILAALAVDGLRDNSNNRNLALQSLHIFRREIAQNLAGLDDAAPYHDGLRTVVRQAIQDPTQNVDLRSIGEGLQPAVLLNTAWQTALATGALTHIDVETVSALSLTYSIQQRFVDDSRAQLPRRLANGAPTMDNSQANLAEVYAYANQLVRGEQELRGVYEQALAVLDAKLGNNDSARTAPGDSATQ